MIICPNCRNSEPPGALFCSRCGNRIEHLAADQPAPETSHASASQSTPPQSKYKPSNDLSIMLLDGGDVIRLSGRSEYTIGRASPDQPNSPDVDLTAYRAYERGVSRLHVRLQVGGEKMSITDLNSVNGTLLNGKRLPANQPYLVNHGDILTLGKMKIQILVRN